MPGAFSLTPSRSAKSTISDARARPQRQSEFLPLARQHDPIACVSNDPNQPFTYSRGNLLDRSIAALPALSIAGENFWRGERNDAMSNQSNSRTNRREILALTLGAAALLSLLETPAYAAKVSKASVRYQDSPKGGSECSNCKLFVPPNACKNVAGEISPKGWCALWVKV